MSRIFRIIILSSLVFVYCSIFDHSSMYAQRLSIGFGVSTLSHEDIFPDNRFSLQHTIAIPNYWGQMRVSFSKLYVNGTIQFDKRAVESFATYSGRDSLLYHYSLARNSVMLGLGYYWLTVPLIKVYSDVNIGYQMVIDADRIRNTSAIIHDMAYHVTFIGFRFGGKLAVTSEIGYGRKGIFAVGLSYGR